MEFSGLLALDVDALGRPTGMKAMTENDVILSSVLPINVRDATREVEDSSSTWEAGGDPQIAAYVRSASGNIASVSGSVGSVVDGSGHWFSGYNYGLSAWETVSSTSSTWVGGGGLSAPGFEDWNNTFDVVDSDSAGSAFWISGYNYSLSAWETVRDNSGTTWIAGGGGLSADGFEDWNNTFDEVDDGSGNWNNTFATVTDFSATVDTSTALLDGRITLLDVFSGTVDASTALLDGRVTLLDVFSGTVDASTALLDGRVTLLDVFSGTVDASTSVLDGRVTLLDAFSGSVDTSTALLNRRIISLDVFSGTVDTSTALLDGRVTLLDAFSGSVDASTALLDGRVTLLDVFSGTVDTSTALLDGRVTLLDVFSGTVDTSTALLDGRVTLLDVFSGTVDTSTSVLDGRVTLLNDWSGTVDTSTSVLDGRVTLLDAFSGSVDTSTSLLDGRVTLLDVFSGTVDASTALLDGRVTLLDVFSGTVDASTALLDGRVTLLNDWSGTVDTSTATLDGRVDVIEPLVPSATGFTGWNSTKSTVDARASNWDTIYGDRTNIRSVSGSVLTSGTAWLTGATPTLSNDLNANSKNIRGIGSLSGDPDLLVSATTLTVSALAQLKLYGQAAVRIGKNDSDYFVTTDFPLSANNWVNCYNSVRDNSGTTWIAGGGGGGGSFEGSATASAIYVGLPAGSAIDISGTRVGDTVIDAVGNNYILSIDEAAGRVKWVSPPLITGDGDLQTIVTPQGSENATFSLGAATLLIRDVVVGTSLSSGPDSEVSFGRNLTASSCTILSSLSAGPDSVTTVPDLYVTSGVVSGKVGNILANNFGLSSGGSYLVNAGPSLYFSSTTNYMFNRAGTLKTMSDFPQFLTDAEEVIADSAAGYYKSFIQLIDSAGGSETNAASKSYIAFGTTDPSGGAASTDYTVSGSGNGVVINTAGTYEISFDIGVEGVGGSARTGSILRCEVNGVDVGPTSKTGYIRITTGHNQVSYNLATWVKTFTAGQVLKIGATRETTATGSVTTVAGESYLYIRRIL